MFKKLFGTKTDSPDRDGSEPSPDPESDSPSEPTPPTSDRPWLAIAFSLTDLDTTARVRRFAEALADRTANPDTIFSECGECDDGLVTLLVHKKISPDSLPPMDEEARRVLDQLLEELSPSLTGDDYITIACETADGPIQQLVATTGDDEPALRRFVLQNGEVLEQETLSPQSS